MQLYLAFAKRILSFVEKIYFHAFLGFSSPTLSAKGKIDASLTEYALFCISH